MNDLRLDSFIGTFMIDTDTCDKMVSEFTAKADYVRYSDNMRQYWRLLNIHIDKGINDEYVKKLSSCIRQYVTMYPDAVRNNRPWSISLPYNLQKYDPGSHYAPWHCETLGPEDGKQLRILTFLTYLNDVDIDGETEFLYQNIKVKPRKGLTLLWPAGWTHIHRGLPAKFETKYIATGWCVYDKQQHSTCDSSCKKKN